MAHGYRERAKRVKRTPDMTVEYVHMEELAPHNLVKNNQLSEVEDHVYRPDIHNTDSRKAVIRMEFVYQ